MHLKTGQKPWGWRKNCSLPVFRFLLCMMKVLYKVRVGAFSDMENGIRMEQNVKQAGYPAYLVREAAIY